jgi:hypothetical protein
MADQKKVRALLEYDVDQRGIARIEQANNQIARGINKTSDEIRRGLGQSGVASANALAKRIENVGQQYQIAAREANKLADATERASRSSSVQRTQGRLGSVDTAASRASQVLGGLGQGELANAAGLLADLSASASDALPNISSIGLTVGQLGLAAGVAAPLLLAAGAALSAYNAQVSAAHAAYRAARQAQQELAEQIEAGLTSDEARRQLAELEAAEAALTQQRDADISALRGAVTSIAGPIGSVTGAFTPLRESVDESTAALAENQAQQVALEGALGGTALAANDAAEAQRQLASATIEASRAALDAAHQRIQRELDFQRLAETGTSGGVQQQIAANQAEMALIQEELATNTELGALATLQLHGEFAALLVETDRLTNETLGLVEAREKETAAARQAGVAGQRLAQQLEREAQVRNQIAQIQSTINQQRASDELQDTRAQADIQRRRHFENIDFQRQLAQSDEEFAQRRADQLEANRQAESEADSEINNLYRQSNDASLKSTRKYLQDLADIERDSRESILEGASNLDARAVLAAIRQRDRQLEETRRGYEDEQREREADTQQRAQEIQARREQDATAATQRLADEALAYQTQRAQQIAQFEERRQREDMELAISRQREQQDRQARLASQQAQIAELRSHLTMEGAIRRSGFAAALADTQGFFNSLRSMSRGFGGGAASANAGIGQLGQFINRNNGTGGANVSGAFNTTRALAQAGIKTRRGGGMTDGWTLTGENGPELANYPGGTRIFNAADTRAIMGGNTVSMVNNFYDVGSKTNAELEGVVRNAIAKVYGG